MDRAAQEQLEGAHERSVATVDELERLLDDERERSLRRLRKLEADLARARRIRGELETRLGRSDRTDQTPQTINLQAASPASQATVPIHVLQAHGLTPLGMSVPGSALNQAVYQPSAVLQPAPAVYQPPAVFQPAPAAPQAWPASSASPIIYLQLIPIAGGGYALAAAPPQFMMPFQSPPGMAAPVQPPPPPPATSYGAPVPPPSFGIAAPTAPASPTLPGGPAVISLPFTIRFQVDSPSNAPPPPVAPSPDVAPQAPQPDAPRA